MGNEMIIREMKIEDYEKIIGLWTSTEGLGISDADTRENIGIFLNRNVGLSFIAEVNGRIMGTILCGHDGRRGYIYHLTVSTAYRRNGVGKRLVDSSCAKLRAANIQKCHLFVFTDNEQGMDFWNHIGFHKRNDVNIYSKDIRIDG